MGISFLGHTVDNTNSTAYTFSSEALGAATANRWIIVATLGINVTAARTVSTLTVAGESASLVALLADTPFSTWTQHEIWAIDLGTTGGTSGDIVVTYTAGQLNCTIAVFLVPDGLQSLTERDAQTSVSDAPTTIDLDVEKGDYVIAQFSGVATGSGGAAFDEGVAQHVDEWLEITWVDGVGSHIAVVDDATYRIEGSITGTGTGDPSLLAVSLIPRAKDIGNLIHQTSVTTGTGNQTLVAVDGKRDFSDQFSVGGEDVFHYFISNPDAAEWEIGTGHLSGANVLVRDTVNQSSNGDALVSFTAGEKTVTNDLPALEQGGAWDLLETVVASNDATISITGLSSKHFLYWFVWSQIQPTTDAQLMIRTDSDGGASYDAAGGDYAYSNHQVSLETTSPTHAVQGDNSHTHMIIAPDGSPGLFGSAADEDVDVDIILFNPSGTAFTKLTWEGCISSEDGTFYHTLGGGYRLSAADVDAVQFLFSAGNINTGTLKVYGLRA